MTALETRKLYRLCYGCGDEAYGRFRCASCRARITARRVPVKRTPEEYERIRIGNCERRAARKAAGLCAQCCQPCTVYLLCNKCRAVKEEKAKIRRQNKLLHAITTM